jgi:hypothetical protein
LVAKPCDQRHTMRARNGKFAKSRECGLAPPYFRQSFDPRIRRAQGDKVGTIRSWFWGIAIVACFCWLVPSVYSIKYAVSAEKIFVDSKPTDCDFWHVPLGRKGCHYQRVVIARDSKAVRELRPGESVPNERFDSVVISWTKKSDETFGLRAHLLCARTQSDTNTHD